MSKFTIKTLGCKVNQAESDAIAQDLLSSNWTMIRDREQVDVCLINTCTVTQKASMQSRQAVRKTIRANPNAQIFVTGCYAQTAPQEIRRINGVNYIIDQSKKQTIGRIIRESSCKASDSVNSICGDIGKQRVFEPMPIAVASSRTRPFLKIQDGCDDFCTYCIVPYARGRSRSMPVENVLDGIRQLAEAGYHEVVLTGVHLGAYGRDLSPATDLSIVMNRIQDIKAIDRIRLSSIEPLELTETILQLAAESDLFCRHFHIPLQSGDDSILVKMGRPYSRKIFHDLIIHIHQLMPDAAIGVDILVGFPGETDHAFKNTFELIAELPVSYLHVFPFSSRPGTAADKFPNKVSLEMIKERCERMRVLGNKKRMKFYRKFIGQKLPILIEAKRDGSSGLLKGISSNYLPVLIDAGENLKNNVVEVQIEKLEEMRLFGDHTI